MDLKNRLTMANRKAETLIDDMGSIDFSASFFDDLDKIKETFRPLLLNKRNLILITNNNSDIDLLFNDIKNLFSEFEINIIENLNDKSLITKQAAKAVKDPNPEEIVKMFEYIIYGFKPFIFNMNFETEDNILNKLKTIIAINYKNLNQENINTLINSASPVFLKVSKENIKILCDINKKEPQAEETKEISSEKTIDEELLEFQTDSKQETKNEAVIMEKTEQENETKLDEMQTAVSSDETRQNIIIPENKLKFLKEKVKRIKEKELSTQ